VLQLTKQQIARDEQNVAMLLLLVVVAV